MPLKDLFAKAPSPLPPSEEPWPRSETSREKSRQSSLHSATARPTLDEFLRTNYLMIPDFLLKVTQAKVAARAGKSNHDFQSAAYEQSVLNFGTVQGRSTSSTSTNVSSCNIANNNTDKEVKFIESRGAQEKEPTASTKIRSTRNTDMLCTILSRKQSCEEIQVPSPMQPKPRVKKVMRGGSLVTIPPPQPRSKVRQEPVKDGGKSTFSVVDVCLMNNPQGRDDACGVSERSIKETVENPSVEEIHVGKELVKNEGSVNFGYEADNLMTEDSSWDNQGSETEILTEDCEQTQNPLTSCDTAVLDTCKSQNTSYGNSHGNFDEPVSNTCSITAHKADESIVLLSQDPEGILDKRSEKVPDKELQQEFTSAPKSDSDGKSAIAKENEVISEDPRLSRILDRVLCEDPDGTRPVLDQEEMTVCKDTLEETKTEPRPQGLVGVDSQLLTMNDPITLEKSADFPQNLVTKKSVRKQSPVSRKEGKSAGELSEECTNGSNPSEKFGHDKEDKHLKAIDKKDNEVNSSNDEKNVSANGMEEIADINVKGCDDTTVNDNDDKKSDSANSSSPDDEDNEGDDIDDDSDDDAVKANPADDRSDGYAELVMDDSTSEGEDEEYDAYPVNDSDSDEEEGELKSDYEAEDMNLDSDTESATGGITSYQDTTIGARVKQSRRKLQREKRKAKNRKKKASKKRAKAAKQAAKGHVQNRNHDPSAGKKDFKAKQILTPTSQKTGKKPEPKSQGPGTGDKSTEAALKFKPGIPKLPPNNPPKENTLEDGSLLSMVSSFAVDLTVAANEKLFLAKRRGGQHSKKMKKAKRKAEALERIRRGDPPPRTARRVFEELPKPICSFYREGKCRKGSDCSFRHDRSALIKKKEICKFYMYSADNCFAGEDCIYMHTFPCKFFHTSRCRDDDHCRFSHDPLTEETDRLLRAFLNPPVLEDSAQSPQEKNLATSIQQSAGGNSRDEDTSQTLTSSSPYNLRASARKRTLGSDEAGTEGGSSINGKIAKHESPGNDQDNKGAQPCTFFPGLYRDLSA